MDQPQASDHQLALSVWLWRTDGADPSPQSMACPLRWEVGLPRRSYGRVRVGSFRLRQPLRNTKEHGDLAGEDRSRSAFGVCRGRAGSYAWLSIGPSGTTFAAPKRMARTDDGELAQVEWRLPMDTPRQWIVSRDYNTQAIISNLGSNLRSTGQLITAVHLAGRPAKVPDWFPQSISRQGLGSPCARSDQTVVTQRDRGDRRRITLRKMLIE